MRTELLALGVFGTPSRLRERIETLLARGVANPRRSRLFCSLFAAVLLAFTLASPLTPRWIAFAQRAEFEVASIRPHVGPVTISGSSFTPAPTFRHAAMKLTDLVTQAYGVRYEQVVGAPNWGVGPGAARYDIDAKVEDGAKPTREQEQQMLQSLLEDRFKLKVRRETREALVYLLVLAKGGLRMKTADKYTGVRAGPSAIGTRLEGKATTAFLAQQLAIGAGRTVFDRTGLSGNYEWKVEWTPDGAEPVDGSPSLSIFTAVQEQLGLKLESSKAPLETIIIEHAEMPAKN